MEKKLKIKLSDGRILIAEINKPDGKNEELCVYIESENLVQDICVIRESNTEPEEVRVLVWGNSEDEDYTESYGIGKVDEWIEEFCPHCDTLNAFKLSETRDGKNGKKVVTCQGCGKTILVCSICDCDGCGKCTID